MMWAVIHPSDRVGRARHRPQSSRRALLIAALALALAAGLGCEKRALRGRIEPTRDGKTYLRFVDDYGGRCPIDVDGARWSAKRGQRAEVRAGVHTVTLRCGRGDSGADYGIEIPRGTIFHFDYWGP